jgi:Actinobacteria/chloroflexi VLRF1 release factor
MPPGAAAPRRIEVAPGRFPGWIESFADRHGAVTTQLTDGSISFVAADGAVAACQVPFPPLPPDNDADEISLAKRVAAHATADRTVGVLLVRLGGYAAGVFTGAEPKLVASKVGSRLVHGRSAAGGQSQQRFARRRENQARQALTAALVLGGDKRAFPSIRTDVRLASAFEVAVEAFLTVPDPRLTVLRDTPRLFRAIKITLTEPS